MFVDEISLSGWEKHRLSFVKHRLLFVKVNLAPSSRSWFFVGLNAPYRERSRRLWPTNQPRILGATLRGISSE